MNSCAHKDCTAIGTLNIRELLHYPPYVGPDTPLLFCYSHICWFASYYWTFKEIEENLNFHVVDFFDCPFMKYKMNELVEVIHLLEKVLFLRTHFQSNLKSELEKGGHLFWCKTLKNYLETAHEKRKGKWQHVSRKSRKFS